MSLHDDTNNSVFSARVRSAKYFEWGAVFMNPSTAWLAGGCSGLTGCAKAEADRLMCSSRNRLGTEARGSAYGGKPARVCW